MKTKPIKEVLFYNYQGANWVLFVRANGKNERYIYHRNPTSTSVRRLSNLVNFYSAYTNPMPRLFVKAMYGADPGWKVTAIKQ